MKPGQINKFLLLLIVLGINGAPAVALGASMTCSNIFRTASFAVDIDQSVEELINLRLHQARTDTPSIQSRLDADFAERFARLAEVIGRDNLKRKISVALRRQRVDLEPNKDDEGVRRQDEVERLMPEQIEMAEIRSFPSRGRTINLGNGEWAIVENAGRPAKRLRLKEGIVLTENWQMPREAAPYIFWRDFSNRRLGFDGISSQPNLFVLDGLTGERWLLAKDSGFFDVSPTGRYVLTSSKDRRLHRLDTVTGEQLDSAVEIEGYASDPVYGLAAFDSGEAISWHQSGRMTFYDSNLTETKRSTIAQEYGISGEIIGASASPEKNQAVLATLTTVYLVDLKSGRHQLRQTKNSIATRWHKQSVWVGLSGNWLDLDRDLNAPPRTNPAWQSGLMPGFAWGDRYMAAFVDPSSAGKQKVEIMDFETGNIHSLSLDGQFRQQASVAFVSSDGTRIAAIESTRTNKITLFSNFGEELGRFEFPELVTIDSMRFTEGNDGLSVLHSGSPGGKLKTVLTFIEFRSKTERQVFGR